MHHPGKVLHLLHSPSHLPCTPVLNEEMAAPATTFQGALETAAPAMHRKEQPPPQSLLLLLHDFHLYPLFLAHNALLYNMSPRNIPIQELLEEAAVSSVHVHCHTIILFLSINKLAFLTLSSSLSIYDITKLTRNGTLKVAENLRRHQFARENEDSYSFK